MDAVGLPAGVSCSSSLNASLLSKAAVEFALLLIDL
jgi:hypothetical protein